MFGRKKAEKKPEKKADSKVDRKEEAKKKEDLSVKSKSAVEEKVQEKPIRPVRIIPQIPKSRQIVYALRELKRAVLEVVFCICWLDCLIVFMLSILVLKLISLDWYWAFIPAVIYAVLHSFSRLRKASDFGYIEEKVPELKERIRTVADNLGQENNFVLQELNEEVLDGMHLIRTSYFFSFSRLTRELLVLTIISFLITGVSAYGVKFIDFHGVIKDVGDLRLFNGEYDINEELLQYEENLSEDIYGDKSIAELGNELLNLQINPSMSDVDISKVREPEERKFRSSVPVEISAQTDSSFEDSIPKDYQKIVKNYFKDITAT